MSRALGPNASAAPGGAAAGWAVLIACWAVVALSGIIWAAAAMASLIVGGTTEPFGSKFAGDLLHGRTGEAWPHTPTVAVVIATGILAGTVAVLAVGAARVLGRLRPAPGDPVAALARNPRMRALTRRHVTRGATGLRRSLAGTDPRGIDPAQAGLALGRLMRPGGRPGPAFD